MRLVFFIFLAICIVQFIRGAELSSRLEDGLSQDSGETEVTETIEQSNKGVIHIKYVCPPPSFLSNLLVLVVPKCTSTAQCKSGFKCCNFRCVKPKAIVVA